MKEKKITNEKRRLKEGQRVGSLPSRFDDSQSSRVQEQPKDSKSLLAIKSPLWKVKKGKKSGYSSPERDEAGFHLEGKI